MKNQVVFILFMLLLACTNKPHKEVLMEEGKITSLPMLDIAGNLSASELDTFTWNSIAKTVRMIPLSSKRLLGRAPEINYISDELIIIEEAQFQSVSSYDSKGRLKSYFSHVGQGPGEYVYLTYVKFDKQDSTVMVFDNNGKLLKYSLDGKCLDEKILKDRQWGNIAYIDPEGIVYTKNASGANSLISILNREWNVEKSYIMFDSTATDRYKAGFTLMCNRTFTQDKYVITHPLGDTLYSVSKSAIDPILILQKKNHVLTSDVLKESIMKLPKDNDFITYTHLDLFSSYLIYRYYWHGNFSLQLWNIETGKMIGKMNMGQNYQSGFNYVFDSGKKVRLIPLYVTDDYLGFLIPTENCMDDIEGLKEDDNPVLMIIELK